MRDTPRLEPAIAETPRPSVPVPGSVSVIVGLPVIGVRTVVAALVRLAELPAVAFGDDRVLTLPSISVTVGELADERLERLRIRLLPKLQRAIHYPTEVRVRSHRGPDLQCMVNRPARVAVDQLDMNPIDEQRPAAEPLQPGQRRSRQR